ncbi:MAG: hypothetical protein CMM26_09440 [Rhodospirillaceae bacterium]|nr:hypothetical protein [Rhodospirillaceae bacterium]
MSHQATGASFLAGYAGHAQVPNLVCMAPNRASSEEFSEAKLERPPCETRRTSIRLENQGVDPLTTREL